MPGPSPDLTRKLLAGLASPHARVRLSASKALRELSRNEPGLVYAHFDAVADLLTHENRILQWNAILTLANLAPVDREGKLDRILDRFLAPITGPVLITAANTIKGAALIALARPHLAGRIARHILRVETANFATPECRNVAIGHALQSLKTFIGQLSDASKVRAFAKRQVENPRRATANKALPLTR